jgi:hypothetical protein
MKVGKRLFVCCALAMAISLFVACPSPGGSPSSPPPVVGSGLLMSGSVQTSSIDPGLTLPCYWKDGILNTLPTGSQSNGAAYGVTVHGADVYIFGFTQTGTSWTTRTPVYWKNGVLNTLSPPANSFGQAGWGKFDSSGTLYIRGAVWSTSSGNPVICGFWKGGSWTPLPMLTATNGDSNETIIIDSSGNVYFSGSLTISGVQVPVYWENGGTPVQVSLTSVSGAIYGGTVTGVVPTPYASSLTILLGINDSSNYPTPAYMVGSTITAVSTGGTSNGEAWWASLSPSGVLYSTGMLGTWASNSSSQPACWTNWSICTLPTPSGQPYGSAGGAQFLGSDVYIDGNTMGSNGIGSAVYWKNGVLNVLPVGS